MSALRYLPVLPLMLACGLAALLTAVVFAVLVVRSGVGRAVVGTARTALAGVVAAVLTATLTGGTTGGTPGFNLVPGATIAQELNNPNSGLGLVNVAGNVVMFLPVGGLMVLAFGLRWWRATAAGAAISVAIEVTQLTALGRSADIDDVLLNTVGAGLGALVGVVLLRWTTRAAARSGSSVDQAVVTPAAETPAR